MALYFNGAEIPTSGDITFGGVSFNEVRFNGVTFWQSGIGIIAPDVPGFCDASDGQFEHFIRVMWGYSNYRAIYKVWRRKQNEADFILLTTIGDGELWYDDLNVDQGIVYEYRITACWQFDEDACSSPSDIDEGTLKLEIIITPPTETPLTFSASDGAYYDKIICKWNNGTETQASSVNIYRDDILIDTVPFGVTEFADTAVDPGSQHEYYVRFHNSGGEGPESNRDMGSTLSDNIYVLKSGDVMTGYLELSDDPVADMQAATKRYVDDAISAAIAAHTHTIAQVTDLQFQLDRKPNGSWTRSGSTLSIDIEGS